MNRTSLFARVATAAASGLLTLALFQSVALMAEPSASAQAAVSTVTTVAFATPKVRP